MQYTFALLSLFLLIVTLLPLSRHESWWVRGLDFPRLQFTLLASIILLLGCLLLDLGKPSSLFIIASVILCLLYQAWWILPYTSLYPVEVESLKSESLDKSQTLKVMTSNVLMYNRQAQELINITRHHAPDILVTLESDQWWEEQLDTLIQQYPHTIKCALDNLYGMHVYSKFELTNSQIKYLVESQVPSIHTQIQLDSGDSIHAHFLHPAPPSPVENEASSERDAELLAVAKSIAGQDKPVLVTGDLNDVAWSTTTRLFRKISGLLDPRIGRGMFNTFHADYFFIRWPLDHLFHSKHFRLIQIERLRVPGSDHFALLTCLAYWPQHDNSKQTLHADKEDHLWAEEKMQQRGVTKDDVPS